MTHDSQLGNQPFSTAADRSKTKIGGESIIQNCNFFALRRRSGSVLHLFEPEERIDYRKEGGARSGCTRERERDGC